ncbi:hypothetical protein HK405_011421 [Cladochytrium tenue]|nr:hypothetical protein HK405_011421 [Cladochytrium tenue]
MNTVDADLPIGDKIKVVAWTRGDSCIVSASDGQIPGRLILWDSGTLAQLRVIDPQLPRSPVAVSASAIGFWDASRRYFILLDVDELAEDADSGLALQYLPVGGASTTDRISALVALARRGQCVLVAAEDGRGYVLIDMSSKRPLAHLPIDVSSVRGVALSPDGRRVLVSLANSRVVTVYEARPSYSGVLEAPTPGSFARLGTVLGHGTTSSWCNSFSQSGATVLTDGEGGSIRVWDSNELGNHDRLRFDPGISQRLIAIVDGDAAYGWAVSNGFDSFSVVESKTRDLLKSHSLSSGHVVLGMAAHPNRPLVAVVTGSNEVRMFHAGRAVEGPGAWMGSFLSSALGFGPRLGETEIALDVQAGLFLSEATCVAFLCSSGAAKGSPTTPIPVAGVLGLSDEAVPFAVGYEDGLVGIWEWHPGAEPPASKLSLKVMLHLGGGIVTSVVPCNVGGNTLALTVDNTAVLVWDGTNPDPSSLQVLVSPSNPVLQGDDRDADPKCVPIAFARTLAHILATGSQTDGTISIWNTRDKVTQKLLTLGSLDPDPAPILALSWSADDAALVSVAADARVYVHSSVSADLVWAHELWMTHEAPPQPLAAAAFASGGRMLAALSANGHLTSVKLHGAWPSASDRPRPSSYPAGRPVAAPPPSFLDPPVPRGFPRPPESDFIEELPWAEARVRAPPHAPPAPTGDWRPLGHGVAAVALPDLPQGTYDVVCDVDFGAADVATTARWTGVSFVCRPAAASGADAPPPPPTFRGFAHRLEAWELADLAAGRRSTAVSEVRLGSLRAYARVVHGECSVEARFDADAAAAGARRVSLGTVHLLPFKGEGVTWDLLDHE